MKVRQATTMPAAILDTIITFSRGNLHMHAHEPGCPSDPTRLLALMQAGRNAEVLESSLADKVQRSVRCLPVSNHTSCWEEEEGGQHPHDDDQRYEHATLTSKPLYELHRRHVVEPCCMAWPLLYVRLAERLSSS